MVLFPNRNATCAPLFDFPPWIDRDGDAWKLADADAAAPVVDRQRTKRSARRRIIRPVIRHYSTR
jgi:hypothetical protein